MSERFSLPMRSKHTRFREFISTSATANMFPSPAHPAAVKRPCCRFLGLLDTPQAGSYVLKDTEVANLSFADRARIRNREIGFIFQSFNLIGDLTVYENVELPLTYRGLSANERKSAVMGALERVGDGSPRQALARPAFRGTAATRRRCAGTCRQTGDSALRMNQQETSTRATVKRSWIC